MKMTPEFRTKLKTMVSDALEQNLFNEIVLPDGMEVSHQLVAHKLGEVTHQIRNQLLMEAYKIRSGS